MQVNNYQCPACTGPLAFDPESGQLHCEYCASSYLPQEIEAHYAAKEAKAAEKTAIQQAAEMQQSAPQESEWNYDALDSEWGDEAAQVRAYNCSSCGARLMADAVTAATSCPYCGNPTIVPGQFRGSLRPDYIIPFALKKEQAVAALKKHYHRKPFLPRAFKTASHIEEVKGIYVPFWLFSGEAHAQLHLQGIRTTVSTSGDYEITTRDHYDIHRAGSVAFRHIPVDGSSKMPNDYMDSLEPYDYRQMVPFSTGYLPGFLADRYDVSAKRSEQRADKRAAQTVLDALHSTVEGYSSIHTLSEDVVLARGAVQYALFPVWLLTTVWKGKQYLFAMNGQTGKMVGDLPISKGKRWAAFVGIWLGLMAVLLAYLILGQDLLGLLRA